MWVGPDAGRLKYEEEFYEMEKKVDNRWITTEYINAYGEVVHNVFDQVTPRGVQIYSFLIHFLFSSILNYLAMNFVTNHIYMVISA